MNWAAFLIISVIVAVPLMLKKASQISVAEGLAHLKSGALVIDVRSPGEFGPGYLPRAVNIPLDEIENFLPKCVKDKNRVLLLHCQSGMRSGIARRKLKSMGYSNAFNLGSYRRAEAILKTASEHP